jgi:hypothetical protein
MIKTIRAQLYKWVVGAMVNVDMSLTPSKVIGTKTSL